MVWAYVKFELQPSKGLIFAFIEAATSNPKAPPLGGEAVVPLALLLHGMSRLGYEPEGRQLDVALGLLAPQLRRLSPRCLFNTCFTLARWDYRCGDSPGGQAFLRGFTGEAQRVILAMTPAQLVVLAWALSTLGYRPPGEVLTVFRLAVSARPEAYSDEQAWALLQSVVAMGAETSQYPTLLLTRGLRGGSQGGRGGGGEGGGLPAGSEAVTLPPPWLETVL